MKITLTFVFFIICIAFNKNNTLADYRDLYVGNYFCQRSTQKLNSEHTGLSIYNDTTTISVNKDVLDSILDIKVGRMIFKAKLKSNTLYPYPTGNHWGGIFFATDSINFGFSITLSPNFCSCKGKKE